MTELDIEHHLCRVYFEGTNSISRPWSMPLEAPDELREFVELKTFSRASDIASSS